MTEAEQLAGAKRIVQEWLNQQGHDRCWYYPELFNQLASYLGVTPTTEPGLPPLLEFEEGCRRFQTEQYADRLDLRGDVIKSKLVKETFYRETGFQDPSPRE